jgi:Spy/CpxP family protein refolding chaperone
MDMTKRLLGIGTAVAAVVLTAGVAGAQRADDTKDQVGAGPRWQVAQQQQAPPTTPPPQQGAVQQVPPAQAGPGRSGRGQGLGPGPGAGQGRGMGLGPGQGVGRGMGGPGRGMALGQGRGFGPGRGAGMGLGPGLAAVLDLTDDQRNAIQTLQRGTRDQAAGISDELELTRKTLQRELFADKRDAAKVATLATKVAALEKQLLDLHVKTQGAVADLLTPNQRETMRIRR